MVDYRVKCSDLKVRTHMWNTAAGINDEIASDCRTQTCGFNIKLGNTISRSLFSDYPESRKKLVHKIRLTTKWYAQIRGENEKCLHCKELIRNKSKHSCVEYGLPSNGF